MRRAFPALLLCLGACASEPDSENRTQAQPGERERGSYTVDGETGEISARIHREDGASVDGEVIAVNEELVNNLQLLSDDPYQAGWMAKILVSDGAAIENLMARAAYEAQCGEEG